MAYGFVAKNANGEIVVDDTSPVLQLFDDFTESAASYDSTFGLYYYTPDLTTYRFFYLPVGAYVARTHTGGYVSNQSSVRFRKLKKASQLVTNDSFGLRVFNGSGQVMFTSGAEVESIDQVYKSGSQVYYSSPNVPAIPNYPLNLATTGNPITTSLPASRDWFLIAASSYLPWADTWQAASIYRRTATDIQTIYRPYAFQSISNRLSPEPVYFVTAV